MKDNVGAILGFTGNGINGQVSPRKGQASRDPDKGNANRENDQRLKGDKEDVLLVRDITPSVRPVQTLSRPRIHNSTERNKLPKTGLLVQSLHDRVTKVHGNWAPDETPH